VERKNARREQVLELLEEQGGARPGVAAQVSAQTGVPEADVYGVATFYSLLARPDVTHRVCIGASCQLAGAEQKLAALRAAGVKAEGVSCLGQCDRAPAMLDADLEVISDRPRGEISASSRDLAIDLAGDDDASYAALAHAIELGPDELVDELEASGLQGCGGAAFPAHVKWRAVRREDGPRHVVVNADEGEPGTFKDREVLLRRPHRLIEGMAIAARTIGADKAWIYLRGEFQDARRALERALAEATPHLRGLEVKIALGRGAYICGEETALLEALEGRRGMPRMKPPFPTQKGLFGRPTLMHNVETLACVPQITLRGGEWFHDLGRTEPGTKLYCVSGHVTRPGVYELPLGVTLDELVEAAGGYVGTPLAFSPGGASSGFLPMSARDVPLDFGHLAKAGSMLGSAGVVVLNDTVDLARAARWQLVFFEAESCGQCAPCRIGCAVQRRALDRYLETGDPDALRDVTEVAWEMNQGSICGLGMVASEPLTSGIQHFASAFERRKNP